MRKALNAGCLLVVGGVLVAPADAYEFRTRWVERVGNVNFQLPSGYWLDASNRQDHRARLQIGVFDDANGPAPAGGLIGWDMGSLLVEAFDPNDSVDRRTPGRLAPFNSSTDPNANGNPPPPGGDPFESLTDISATVGPQSFVWGFDNKGQPLPQPVPVIRGLNQYVSVFEITVRLTTFSSVYIYASGDLLAASEWSTFGTPIPPDPETQTPGSVTYAPVLLDPISFTQQLYLYPGPTPGSTRTSGGCGNR